MAGPALASMSSGAFGFDTVCGGGAAGCAPRIAVATTASIAVTIQRVDPRGVLAASPRIASRRPSMADGRAMLSAVAGVHVDCDRARSSSKLAYADGFAPQSQHFIVTGTFALAREGGRRVPDQRVEPVDRARELRDRLRAAIATADVHQFVDERGLPRLGAPVGGRRRQHHDRREESGDMRAAVAKRLANFDRARDSHATGQASPLPNTIPSVRLSSLSKQIRRLVTNRTGTSQGPRRFQGFQ